MTLITYANMGVYGTVRTSVMQPPAYKRSTVKIFLLVRCRRAKVTWLMEKDRKDLLLTTATFTRLSNSGSRDRDIQWRRGEDRKRVDVRVILLLRKVETILVNALTRMKLGLIRQGL